MLAASAPARMLLLAGFLLLGSSVQSFAQADLPQNATGDALTAGDFWRAVGQAKEGLVANPGTRGPRGNSPKLVIPIPKKPTTESAVGFVIPIHAFMPPISTPKGAGPGAGAVALLALALLAALAWFGWVWKRCARKDA